MQKLTSDSAPRVQTSVPKANSSTVTGALAEYLAQPPGQVPPEAVELVRKAVLDTVGVALAASHEPSIAILNRAYGDAAGPCTTWVGGGSADASRAALLNATAAHALDFDDVDDLLTGHPSTVLVPAVLAAGESARATGALTVEGYWRGLVVMRALAAGLGVGEHYARGWHATATLGAVGAAAAAATVLQLNVEQVRNALGIAVSRAAGSRENFGSMTKPLHAGLAASDGVVAATLAHAGFTAGSDPVGGANGFLALYSGGAAPTPVERAVATERVVAALHDPGAAALNVKLFPCCYATNAAVDASLDLLAGGLSVADIAALHIDVPPAGLQPLTESVPQTGLEAKFSLSYVVASCLIDGSLGLDAFTDAAVRRESVLDLATRVTASENLTSGSTGRLVFAAEVVAHTRSGITQTARCDAPRGHASRPSRMSEIQAKFDDCVAFGGADSRPDLAARLCALPERSNVADIFSCDESGAYG